MHPVILVIDAQRARAQRVAQLLTLSSYRPVLAANPYLAFDRLLHEKFSPDAILVGRSDHAQQPLFQRLLHRLGKAVPVIPISSEMRETIPLYADGSGRATHVISQSCLELLESIWRAVPSLRQNVLMPPHSLIIEKLPEIGLSPRSSRKFQIRNDLIHISFKAAYQIIGPMLWPQLMADIGMPDFQDIHNWPPDNDYFSPSLLQIGCLYQAVALAGPSETQTERVSAWGQLTAEYMLSKTGYSRVFLQTIGRFAREKILLGIIKDYCENLNGSRGEDLNSWTQRPDGSYLLAAYSNIYAYGRLSSQAGGCANLTGAFGYVLAKAGLQDYCEVREIECSTQTLTGHCLLEFRHKKR